MAMIEIAGMASVDMSLLHPDWVGRATCLNVRQNQVDALLIMTLGLSMRALGALNGPA